MKTVGARARTPLGGGKDAQGATTGARNGAKAKTTSNQPSSGVEFGVPEKASSDSDELMALLADQGGDDDDSRENAREIFCVFCAMFLLLCLPAEIQNDVLI